MSWLVFPNDVMIFVSWFVKFSTWDFWCSYSLVIHLWSGKYPSREEMTLFFLRFQWLLVHCNYGQLLHGRCIILLYKDSFHKYRPETLCNVSSQSLHISLYPYLLDNKPQHALFLRFSFFGLKINLLGLTMELVTGFLFVKITYHFQF